MQSLRILRTLVHKEFLVEARGKEVLTLLSGSSVMVAALIGAGVSSAILEARTVERIFPMLLWLSFFFTAVLAMTRAHEGELEGRGYEALILAKVSGAQQFVSKVVVTSVLLIGSFVGNLVALAVVLGQPLDRILWPVGLVGVLATLGVSPLLVLLGGIASTSRMRGVLLPLLVFPLLFPFFLAGTELTAEILANREGLLSSPWVAVLVAASTLFMLLGINLYEVSLKD
jgi:heme exporter protein B